MLKSRLKIILAEKGLKNKELADLLGTSPTVISNWINGTSYPTAVKLFELAHKLDVKVDDLYEYTEE
ncbi:helix-turn-helix family protein [Kurthia sp. 11kri321]|nr:helix-turn-helix transcriptional regulator [Kurthia sp. 11kri321]AMA62652.1 helix-turn-helix family protein [Kurthia sp. 11kri321]